eukprot:scaffold1726_cov56-Phaeocystis_antarctica.AAC.2
MSMVGTRVADPRQCEGADCAAARGHAAGRTYSRIKVRADAGHFFDKNRVNNENNNGGTGSRVLGGGQKADDLLVSGTELAAKPVAMGELC